MRLRGRLTERLWGQFRSLLPEHQKVSLEFGAERWDNEYASGQWDYLETLPELPRYSLIAGYVRHFGRGGRILEIGCGTGLLLDHIQAVDFAVYRGVDVSVEAISSAERRADQRTSFVAADGRSYNDGTIYDLIIFNEVLYYFDDCISILEHYRQMLAKSGRILVSMVEGVQSRAHWQRIQESTYQIEVSARIVNAQGVTWNCRVLQNRR